MKEPPSDDVIKARMQQAADHIAYWQRAVNQVEAELARCKNNLTRAIQESQEQAEAGWLEPDERGEEG